MPEISNQLFASLSQYHDFLSSVIWVDISNEINSWLEDIRNQLEQADNIEELRRFQGIAEACRYFLALPEEIINTLEARSTDNG